MSDILNQIKSPADLRLLDKNALGHVVREMRDRIIEVVSKAGGHLGASLGTVELTAALHYCYQTPDDQLIWDVGHQAYGHKIITGRNTAFETLRKNDGLSGFPKIEESLFDAFGTGHSSTSISAILGMAADAENRNIKRKHIAVIGDAAMQAGMSFEALNHLGDTDYDVLVVLNDNCMSIDPSVGALNTFLQKSAARFKENPTASMNQFWSEPDTRRPSNIFEDLGIRYFGPIDGHDVQTLLAAFEKMKAIPGPKLLHVLTVKGRGYEPAESGNPTKWHAPGLFDPQTGKVLKDAGNAHKPDKFQDVFGKTLVSIATKHKNVYGVTPAMPTGSSLTYMMEKFPERTFDVGIAEQHAVTFSAGIAKSGGLPFCVIYSTFLQRGYDQLIHDVVVQKLKVIFCIDRAGLVGEDGGTHQGVYDPAYLRPLPGLMIAAPRNEQELVDIMYRVVEHDISGPVAIRYPRGRGFMKKYDYSRPSGNIEPGKGERLSAGSGTAVLSIGTVASAVQEAIIKLKEEGNTNLPAHYDMRFLKPLDGELLHEVFESYDRIITVEDGTAIGGLGSAVCEFAAQNGYQKQIVVRGVPDELIEHASQSQQHARCGLDAHSIYELLK